MNFLDLIPKWVWMALVATFAATSCKLKIENGSLTLEVEKHATRIAELKEGISSANAQAALAGAAMEKRVREAAVAAAVREKSLAADRARAISELDGLRDAVSRTKRGFGLQASGNSIGTGLDAAIALGDDLLTVSDRYVALAEKCDRHVSDIKTLTDSWPK